MKKILRKMKKPSALLALTLLSLSLFAQEADDGFVVPLGEDLSNAIGSSGAEGNLGFGDAPSDNTGGGTTTSTTAAAPSRNIQMGLWIETQSDNVALIRNVKDGTKSGYEFDNAHFLTEANWWFWGEVKKGITLDAEISVLNFDKTLYQASTYGANVPDVTWGDGFQTLSSMPFSFVKNGNDNEIGAFNKLGLNLATPFIDIRLGYGKLKENGMSTFKGIYTVIDRWDSVEDGYTELKNGRELREFGDFKIDALAAFSQMRNGSGNPYGLYDYLDVKYADLAEAAVTFGSVTSEEQLFLYNRTNKNAVSGYAALTPISPLKLEGHWLGTFGTDQKIGGDSMAGAGKISWNAESWNVNVMESIAGVNAHSVWGSDGETYDDINADTWTSWINAFKSFGVEKLPFALGLDEAVTVNDSDNMSEGLVTFRTEPYADLNFENLFGKSLTAGLYGVVKTDRLAKETSEDRNVVTYLDEIGLELSAADVLTFKKFTFDYALSYARGDWNASDEKYPLEMTYHSIMANAQITDPLNVHVGSIVRNDATHADTNVPFAFAVGMSVKKVPLPGRPMLWVHFTYSMNPYEDNNYSLYRADDSQNNPLHRTYLLNTLNEDTTTSHISIGLIWDL